MAKPSFGWLLFKLRERRELSLREVGRLAGVDHAYVSRLECGHKAAPAPAVVRKLARALKADAASRRLLLLLADRYECGRLAGETAALFGLRGFIASKRPDLAGVVKRLDDRLAEIEVMEKGAASAGE